MPNHTNKVALITGVSSGIGAAAARRFLEAGFSVFGTSRRAETGTITAGVHQVALDITDDDSVAAAIRHVIETAGHIDVLINNAGYGLLGGIEEASVQQAQALFDANVIGTFRVVRAVLPGMRARRSGRIVNTSSVLGFLPSPYMGLYAATKFAIEGYTESLDHEVRTLGIRAVLVQPAYTRTAFDENMVRATDTYPDYAAGRSRVETAMKTVVEIADDPSVVASAMLLAATAKQPKLRYPAGRLAGRLAVAKRFAPTRTVDRAVRRQLALDS